MLLLGGQKYKMNDSLEKMYPILKSIKRVELTYAERLKQEKMRFCRLRDEDRPRKPMVRFIRPVNGPVLVVLEVGDYAVIQRGNRKYR